MKENKIPSNLSALKQRLMKFRIPAKFVFILIGVASTIWFLIRVIPKPSRAAYPCMKIAYPFMSGFVVWIISITGIFSSIKFIKSNIKKQRYIYAGIGVITLVLAFGITAKQSTAKLFAGILATDPVHPANAPMGDGVGVIPGAVTWAWNPDATNENCTNIFPKGDVASADCFWMNKNNNQDVINHMVQQSILRIGNNKDISIAWQSLFKNFNARKGKGNVGYNTGETVFLKINNGAAWSIDSDFEYLPWASQCYSESAPQLIYSIVKQLVDVAGVPQNKIYVSDPIQKVYQDVYDLIKADYPNVIIADKVINAHGRVLLTKETEPAIFYSDDGALAIDDETLYTELQNADYLINMSALKAHARAGLTISAKNHYGSHTRDGATHLHPGLVAPENDIPERIDYGMYRTQVDLMGSKYLGKNTLLHVVDGLWSGTEGVSTPVKWAMEPFNGDWPSSIFMSQDQVAIESVCFDFLRSEVKTPGSSSEWHNRPLMAQGVDDYMHQAADPANWPVGVTYDPDGGGIALTSLGTHEHWNDIINRQYSINLGGNSGILLIPILSELETGSDFFAHNTEEIKPVFDGVADESLWQDVSWQYIDQVWMPYADVLDPDDFSGRFKVMWSDIDNKLYVLAETIDDIFVDGYVFPNGGYPDFDILEIFIDEDKSGGNHVGVTSFDNANAENAFSLHIAINRPADGASVTAKTVVDIKGPGWNDYSNYADHMSDFIVKRSGNKLTWEFSLEVYDDQYDSGKDADGNASSLVALTEGKTIGFAMAYCDNDTPGTTRDNFIGSDWGQNNGGEFNDYWKNADNYAILTLKSSTVIPNRPPTFIQDTYTHFITEKGTIVSVVDDLRTLAVDLDLDKLSFTAESDNSELTISIINYELLITTTTDYGGISTVTVTANDGRGGEAQTEFSIISNNPPEFTQSIDDFELEQLNQEYIIIDDLNSICTDADGDEITYSVVSGDLELEATINNTTLKVIGLENFSGLTTVTVTATDIHRETGQTAFQVSYNYIPEFIETIKDTTITNLGVNYTIVADLNTICSDNSDANLTYLATSDNINLKAIVTGSKLEILGEANFSGTAIVTVKAENSNGGATTTTFSVSHTPISGINSSLSATNLFEIYPNPTQGEANIIFSNINSSELIQLSLYNLQGKIIQYEEIQISNSELIYRLNLQDQANGAYIVRIVNGEITNSKKIYKKP